MDKCAVFVAYFIFAGRKISREENFAGGKFREIPFAVDIIFAGGKFRAKSEFANIAKISSTRNIGVIQYCILKLEYLGMLPGANTIKKKKKSTQNKSQTHRSRA